ncbi:phospholipase D-like domain-containing protein [candidate division KSB1 bacterium]
MYPETADKITGFVSIDDDVANILEETDKDPIVLFCPRDSCAVNLEYMINISDKVHCAFFDLDLENVITALQRKSVEDALVVVDADYFEEEWESNVNFRKDTRKAFMHNKFCIFDEKIVWTGSMNPTHNGDEKNNNNVIIIFSENLAETYEEEFQELWAGTFGKGKEVKNPKITVNSIEIESYFCPEDFCANEVMEELDKAEKSIYFMTFSFTHDKIGDLLVKKHDQGVEVRGVFEKRQNSQYSEFSKLNESGIDVKLDSNKATMHHKVFIIDEKVVVTGSFNPTMNGDTNNDENIIIIKNKAIANSFLEEFDLVYG